ncbi:MAG: hypothetical protein IKY01_01750 [Prevotella sp.]|nr:hypothetical protein [Prevotella sp.]
MAVNRELKEKRKQKLPTATAFSSRDSLSKLGSPLGLPKEFAEMEQKLQELHTKEDDSLFYYHSSEDRIVLSHAMFWTMTFSTTYPTLSWPVREGFNLFSKPHLLSRSEA